MLTDPYGPPPKLRSTASFRITTPRDWAGRELDTEICAVVADALEVRVKWKAGGEQYAVEPEEEESEEDKVAREAAEVAAARPRAGTPVEEEGMDLDSDEGQGESEAGGEEEGEEQEEEGEKMEMGGAGWKPKTKPKPKTKGRVPVVWVDIVRRPSDDTDGAGKRSPLR